jgi:biotin operon repressor
MSYQNLQVLNALRSGPKTTAQLVIGLRIMSVTKRISELRRAGYEITSTERWMGRSRIVTYRLEA